MPDILVTENIAGEEIQALRREFDVAFEAELWKSAEKFRRSIGEFRALMVRNETRVTAEVIAAGKRLMVIGRAGVGLDNVDAAAASEAGIVVAYTPEQNSVSVAELAIGLMLSLARMIPAADKSTRGGQWDRQRFLGGELFEKTLGIVGLGRIGVMVAQRAAAFGMRVVAYDAFVKSADAAVQLMTLDELLGAADFVSVHIPKTPNTINLFNDAAFSKMKPGAYLVNTSRGGVVDEAALIRALREKKIGGAALDVRATEPPEASALAEMENVIVTPHIGAFTAEGQKRVVASLCRDVGEVLRGRAAQHYFNFPTPRRQLVRT